VEKSEQKKPRRKSAHGGSSRRGKQIGRFLVLLFATVVIVDAIVGDRGLLAMRRARRQYDELSATIVRQRAENEHLREEARRLREDPAAIEELARRELGLIRPGEKVFIVKDLTPIPTPEQ
jgi:cell division protein FtsB